MADPPLPAAGKPRRKELMKTFLLSMVGKVAGTLRVPSARGPRPRQMIEIASRHSRGGRQTESACYFFCAIPVMSLMLLTGCGLDGPVPRKPQPEAAAAASQPAETKPDEADKTPTEKANADKVAAQDASTQKPATEKTPGRTRKNARQDSRENARHGSRGNAWHGSREGGCGNGRERPRLRRRRRRHNHHAGSRLF